ILISGNRFKCEQQGKKTNPFQQDNVFITKVGSGSQTRPPFGAISGRTRWHLEKNQFSISQIA
ncbi:hypothetical protein, partial [Aeromonas salmonicida]|uniref:hypothetical protein n=1 Tax=Aeromonas salmonicida TaxID=645 RepID=UPI001A8DF4C6